MDRRDLIRFGAATVAASLQPALLSAAVPGDTTGAGSARTSTTPGRVEQWGMFEIALSGPSAGNPYKEVALTAVFTMDHRNVRVTGFYDGDGTYRVRFMPDAPGRWSYVTESSARELAARAGDFLCTPPTTPGNHGPVGTAHQFHFQYADGTPYFPFGTTTYAYLFTADENAKASIDGRFFAISLRPIPMISPLINTFSRPVNSGLKPAPSSSKAAMRPRVTTRPVVG